MKSDMMRSNEISVEMANQKSERRWRNNKDFELELRSSKDAELPEDEEYYQALQNKIMLKIMNLEIKEESNLKVESLKINKTNISTQRQKTI